ncbi:DNA-binding response regulator [Corallococcus sp. AB030]|nr:DNA-binding response regulator [Corallococcus sp. AB030]
MEHLVLRLEAAQLAGREDGALRGQPASLGHGHRAPVLKRHGGTGHIQNFAFRTRTPRHNQHQHPLPEQMKCELTPTEVTVAMGMLSNWNDQRIAEELGISRNTVKSHVKSIFATLRVDGRLDLLYQAARLNMPV